MNTVTINPIMQDTLIAMYDQGSGGRGHFFSAGAMEWFDTAIYHAYEVTAPEHGTEYYFITSERSPSRETCFTVRRYVGQGVDVQDLTAFHSIKSMSRAKSILDKVLQGLEQGKYTEVYNANSANN